MLVNSQTSVLGIIGNPLKQSLSTLMYNVVFEAMDLNCLYLPFEIASGNLGKAIDAVRVLGITGINVTIPYKTSVIEYLDELSLEAKACQAVNCISNEKGTLIGHNTDGQGFMRALLEAGITPDGRAVMIGAGGVARSIAHNLTKSPCQMIEILDIQIDRAKELAAFVERSYDCQARPWVMNQDNFNAAATGAKLIVNCSPVGMMPEIEYSPVDSLAAVPQDAVICDVIYNPPVTRLLQAAQARGLKTIDGTAMFIHQGALSLEIILGIIPPLALMKEVIANQFK